MIKIRELGTRLDDYRYCVEIKRVEADGRGGLVVYKKDGNFYLPSIKNVVFLGNGRKEIFLECNKSKKMIFFSEAEEFENMAEYLMKHFSHYTIGNKVSGITLEEKENKQVFKVSSMRWTYKNTIEIILENGFSIELDPEKISGINLGSGKGHGFRQLGSNYDYWVIFNKWNTYLDFATIITDLNRNANLVRL